MKRYTGVLVLVLCWFGLLADIGSFRSLGTGRFSGKLGMYAAGDSLGLVMRVGGTELDTLKYLRSINGGQSWIQESISTLGSQEPSVPTISRATDELLVGSTQNLYKSTDGGATWINYPFSSPASENSPYIEKRGEEYLLFSKNLAYPEDMQRRFALPGTNEFPIPQWGTDSETGVHGIIVPFAGMDTFEKPVFTNGDLYIKNDGLGTNGGWPTFNGPVTISGHVISDPEQYPAASIFRGGLYDEAPEMNMPNTAACRTNGAIIGPPSFYEEHIVLVEVDGTTYTAWLGTIQPPRRNYADAWPDYPYHPYIEDSQPAFRNNYLVQDTLWVQLGGGNCGNRMNFVNSKLWIRGNFSTHQIWSAADTISIIGDITLSNTTPGSPPTGNNTDSVFLISETNIQLKYGFWNPITQQREHPLCRADNDPIEIYATLAATSKHSDEMRDGSFTFEYQHPHPSIPDLELNIPGVGDTLFRYLDIHRNRYPLSPSFPWPSWLDYPWYNPLWPEAHPYLERGTVRIWGSVFQARKGFMRRPYLISEWDGNGIWNMGNDYYGGTSAPESTTIQLVPGEEVILQNQNYPGTTGSMVGYKVILMPDNRFVLSNRFGDDYMYMGGIWNVGMGLSFLDFYGGIAYNGYFLYPSIMPYLKVSESKCMDRHGDVALYGMDEVLMRYSGDDYYWSDLTPNISSIGKIQAVVVDDWYNSWVYQLQDIGAQRIMQIRMMNSNTAVVDCAINWNVGSCANDIARMQDGRIVAAKMNDAGVIEIWELSNDPYMIDTWNLSLGTGHPIVTDEHCRIYLIPNGSTAFEVVLFQPLDNPDYPPFTWGTLYYAHADVSVGIDDPVVPSIPAISFNAYPNPMKDDLKLEIKGAEQHEASIEVYNLKGQKVAAYNLQKGMQHFTWKGLDSSDRRVGSGIYFIRLLVDGKLAGTRRICRIE